MAINGKINLMKYVGARKVCLGGENGVFIPVEQNPTIYAGDKGVYASVRIVEHESTFDDAHYTHFIAAALDKKTREEMREAFGDERVKSVTPILGNATDYSQQSSTYETVEEDTSEEVIEDMPEDDNSGIEL